MDQWAALEAVARTVLRILHEHNGEQASFRINRHLHHDALDLLAAPDRVSGQQIDSFDPRLLALLEIEQQQLGGRHRCDVCFVE